MKFVEFSTFLFWESATLLLWSLNTFGLRHRQAFIHINGLAFFLGNRGTNLLGNILTFLSRYGNKISKNESDNTSKAAACYQIVTINCIEGNIHYSNFMQKVFDLVFNQLGVVWRLFTLKRTPFFGQLTWKPWKLD